jgi:predicted dehydrogenase
MGERKLKTAVLGLDDAGKLLLESACELGHFHIQAVADRDPAIAQMFADQYNCAAYDDYRRLVMQNQLDCLLVAAPIHTCDEHLRTAIKKKFNILKLPPPARSLEEAAEFVRLSDDENVKFAVANPARFAPALPELLQQCPREQVFLLTAACHLHPQHRPSWENDPKLAGGGVLLHRCFGIIDLIVSQFDMPQQVYALTTNWAHDRQQRFYRTEEAALVTMKFSDSLIANLIACPANGADPQPQTISVYTADKVLTVSENGLTGNNRQEQRADEWPPAGQGLLAMKKVLENFALSILSPDNVVLSSTVRENLRNMAVIESAYLSARTAMPEEPARVLRAAFHEPRFIWPT